MRARGYYTAYVSSHVQIISVCQLSRTVDPSCAVTTTDIHYLCKYSLALFIVAKPLSGRLSCTPFVSESTYMISFDSLFGHNQTQNGALLVVNRFQSFLETFIWPFSMSSTQIHLVAHTTRLFTKKHWRALLWCAAISARYAKHGCFST